MHVTLVTLGVHDLAAAIDFYDGLGWRRSLESVEGEVAFMVGGGPVLSLYRWELLARDAGLQPTDPGAYRGIALAINFVGRPEVDEFVATAVGLGARVVAAPVRTSWGGYSGYLADLDGHLLEVAHNPFWPMDANGQVHPMT